MTWKQSASQPGAAKLDSASDSGASATDNVTKQTLPTFIGRAPAGVSVTLMDGAVSLGSAVSNQDGDWTITVTVALAPGEHSIIAVTDDGNGNVESAPALLLTIDTDVAAPGQPNLLDAADSGASNTDNLTSTAAPVLAGTTEAGALVHVYDGAALLGTTTADGSGNWIFTSTALADGEHSMTATATDIAGNVSAPSGALAIVVDTAVPAPGELDLVAASDSGPSADDNTTGIATPVIAGKAEAGSAITLYDGLAPVGTAVADASGDWSITTGVLADGVHTLTATASDAAGNVSPSSSALIVTIDAAAVPAPHGLDLTPASDSGASDGDNTTSLNIPVITGLAEAGATVRLYDGAALAGTAVADAGGNWSITMSSLDDGAHHLTATATDTAGNVSLSSLALDIVIDTATPLAPTGLDLVASADSGTANDDDITNFSQPVITGSAQAGSTVTLFEGTTQLGTAVADAGGVWTITASALADGIHNLSAKASDAAGNVSPASGALAVTIETVTPVAPSNLDMAASSDSGSSNTDNITQDRQPVIAGKADAGSTVIVHDGATVVGTVVADSGGDWTITTSVLADGVHNLSVTASDMVGNISPAVVLIVTVDNATPAPFALDLAAASDRGASNSDNNTNVVLPVINGKAEAGSTVVLFDGATEIGTALANAGGNWSITTTTLSDGVHGLTARSTDLAGNASALSATLNVSIETVAPAAPAGLDMVAASDRGISNTDDLTSLNRPVITGTAEAGSTVRLFRGATQVGSAVTNGAGVWTLTTNALVNGINNLTATATDVHGNVSPSSSVLSLTIDATSLAPTEVDVLAASDSGMSNSDNNTSTRQPVVSGKAEANASVILYDGATQVGTATADAGGAWTITTAMLADGVHNLMASATDIAGGTSPLSAALVLTVDNLVLAPTELDLAAASDSGRASNDKLTKVNQPVITGKAEAGSTVVLYEGAVQLGTAVADANGVWSISASTLADGVHNLTAMTTDIAGNVSSFSSPLTITVDTTAPAAPGDVDLLAASDSGASSTDNITAVTTPTYTGHAETGSTVTLYEGSTVLGTATASDGNWSISIGVPLALGTHNLSFTATDAAGNESSASAATIAVDREPVAPSQPDLGAASDSGMSDSDNLTNVTAPAFHGSSLPGVTVTLYDGVNVRGTTTSDASGNWSVTSDVLGQGAHTLTAVMTNPVGPSPASAALTVTIDSVAPSAPAALDLATSSDNGVSDHDNTTAITTPVLTGTAEAGSVVTLYEGSAVLGTGIADGAGAWAITSAALGLGTHTLTATSLDAAGNVSATAAALAVVISQLPPAPSTPELTAASDTGLSNTDTLTKATLPVFTGTAEAGATVTLYEGATVRGTGMADGAGAWSITANAALADGSHTLTATATNLIGASPLSGSLAIAIDTVAPATPGAPDLTTDSGMSDTDNLTNTVNPTLSGSGEANASIDLYDGAILIGSTTADAGGAWSLTSTPALSNGAHALTVKSTDQAGNVSAASVVLSITIDTVVAAPSLPDMSAATDTGISGTDNVTSERTPVISGTAEAFSVVELRDGATVLGTATANGSGAWSITSPALDLGSHSLTAVATDRAGNLSVPSAALLATIMDLPLAPSLPDLVTAHDTGASDSDNVTYFNRPMLTGTAEAGATVTLYEGATVLGSAVTNPAGEWLITSALLTDGVHHLTAKASNPIGTSASTAALTVTIDTVMTTPTGVDMVAASDTGVSSTDNITRLTTPTFTGFAEPGSLMTLFEQNTTLGTGYADTAGIWTITTIPISEGLHGIGGFATDLAGNASANSAGILYTIDTVCLAPSAPDLASASDSGTSSTDNMTVMSAPVFNGTAEANAIIQLFEGATLLGTGTANASGAWTVTSSALSLGVHNITAVATDPAGNASLASDAISVNILPLPPAPSAPNLIDASDTGMSNSDNITKLTTPTFNGTAEAGATVKLYNGATQIGSAIASGAGDWLITSAALAQGTHNLTATTTNHVGTSVASGALSVTIDTALPAAPAGLDLATASDNGISSTDNTTTITTPVLAGTAEAGSTVTLYEGATVYGTAVADGAGAWSITSSTLSLGSHTLTATAQDVAGNVSPVSAGLAMVIAQLPTVPSTPDLALASDSGASGTDNLTNVTLPVLTGTAEAGSTVTLYEGATVRGTGVTASNGTWSITANAALAQGNHTLTAMASNLIGTSAASAGLTITVDTTVPATPSAPDLISDSGASGIDNLTNTVNPIMSGNAEANSSVSLYEGATLLGTTTASSSGAWSLATTPALSNGVHALTVKATDLAGNTSAASTALSVTIDSVVAAPSVPDMAAASDNGVSTIDNITTISTPVFTGTAEINAVVVLRNGSTVLGTATTNASGVWSITSSALAVGNYNLTAVATDPAGNVSAPSGVLVVGISTAPTVPSAPDLENASDTGISSTDNITKNTTPTLTGTADAGATVVLYDGGTSKGTATANGAGVWSITSSALTAGSHSLTAKATNLIGTSASSAALVVVVDTTTTVPSSPDLSAASDTGISSTDNVTSVRTPTFTGTAEANATVTLYEGSTVWGTTVANGTGTWSLTTSAMADGVHNVGVAATDIAGNQSAVSATLAVTIDGTTPAASSAPDLPDNYDRGDSNNDNLTNLSSVPLTGVADPNSRVTVYANGVALPFVLANSVGAWSTTYTNTTGVSEVVSFQAAVSDVAGNVSSMSAPLTVTFDRSGPAAAVIRLAASSDTGASNNDQVTNDTTPTFYGTAEPNSTVKLTMYDSTVVDLVLGTVKADANGNWEITAPSVTNPIAAPYKEVGSHVTDTAGNITTGPQQGLRMLVDTVNPIMTSFQSVPGSDSGVWNDFITNVTTPVFTGVVTFNTSDLVMGAGAAGFQVTLYEGSTVLGTSGITVTGGAGTVVNASWTIATSTMTAGPHNLTVKVVDAAGNTSSALAQTVVIDTLITTHALPDMQAASDTGSSNSDNITVTAQPFFSGVAEPNASIKLFNGATQIAQGTANAAGAWTLQVSALGLGQHSITAVQTDVAGNAETSPALLVTRVATNVPVVLDLVGHGIDLLAASTNRATLDVDGDGILDFTGWAGSGNALLVFDANGDSKANGAAELALAIYGPPGASDLEGLAYAFDGNKDGVFDAHDAEWLKFGAWQDRNQDGVCDQGEFQTLEQLGIVSIQLTRSGEPKLVNGNTVFGLTTFTWADGHTGTAADVAFGYVLAGNIHQEVILIGAAA